MSLDAETSKISKTGKVTITAAGIVIDGFEGTNCSCRDVAVLACMWAIGELARETLLEIQEPGGSGNVAIGD